MTEPTVRPVASSRPVAATSRPFADGSSPGLWSTGPARTAPAVPTGLTVAADSTANRPAGAGSTGPSVSRSTAGLAERCSAAAVEVGHGGCSAARLAAAAEALEAALAEIARWDRALAGLRTTRDGAGDLLAALCAAGLDPADRAELERALARLLTQAAAALRDAPAG